jgi:hypothetical protein
MIDRRSVLAVLGAAALAAAAGPAAADPAAGVPIGAIEVSGLRTATLQALAPMVARQIATILGPRYQPGVRGGATLVINLTLASIDDSGGGADTSTRPYGHDAGSDALTGDVALYGPRREALAEFPMLATSGAVLRSTLRPFPDPRRLDMLARAFAWWTVRKIS